MSKTQIAWQKIHNELSGSQHQFISQLQDIESVQEKQLLQILKRNAQTSFGQKYHFSKINNVSDFIQNVPVHNYDDCAPFLQEIAADPSADIICFEETGGSTQGSKLIPYTQHSFSSYQNALLPWLDDLLLHRPGIKQGTAYWSISPIMREQHKTFGGHPIGLTNDALYFGDVLASKIIQTLAVSPKMAELKNLADWRYNTLLDLLLAEDLSFISVWSPTFLLELIQYLPTIAETLLSDIQRLDSHRAAIIEPAITNYTQDSVELDTQTIWPKLDTISCWTDGSATSFISAIQHLFPHAFVQGKGLLATEGVVTIPLHNASAPVLSVTSGFYEFRDENEQFKLAHELEQNKIYSVLLTNNSGLYRYDLGDKVYMEGMFHSAPMLRFIGRGDRSSDVCGEKLTDDFVLTTLASFEALKGCHFLYPATSITDTHYILVTEKELAFCIAQLDTALSNNPQYRYARQVGQLKPLQHIVIPKVMQRYTQWCSFQGQNLGDIKPPVLITDTKLIRFLHESL